MLLRTRHQAGCVRIQAPANETVAVTAGQAIGGRFGAGRSCSSACSRRADGFNFVAQHFHPSNDRIYEIPVSGKIGAVHYNCSIPVSRSMRANSIPSINLTSARLASSMQVSENVSAVEITHGSRTKSSSSPMPFWYFVYCRIWSTAQSSVSPSCRLAWTYTISFRDSNVAMISASPSLISRSFFRWNVGGGTLGARSTAKSAFRTAQGTGRPGSSFVRPTHISP